MNRSFYGLLVMQAVGILGGQCFLVYYDVAMLLALAV